MRTGPRAGRPSSWLTEGVVWHTASGDPRLPTPAEALRRTCARHQPDRRSGDRRGLLAESGFFVRVIQNGQVVRAAGDVPDQGFPISEKPGFATVESGGRSWRTFTIEPPSAPRQRELRSQGTVRSGPRPARGPDRGDAHTRRADLRSGHRAGGRPLPAFCPVWHWPRFRDYGAPSPGVTSTRDLSRRLPESDAAEEVNELARSVNEMLTRLEQSTAETESALEATRRFAADVGHELRTPLTSIRASDALRRNPSMAEQDRRAILEGVAAEQQELVTLLDALQALARGDAGPRYRAAARLRGRRRCGGGVCAQTPPRGASRARLAR